MTTVLPRFPSILHALLAHAERGADGTGVTLIPEPGRAQTLRYDALVGAAARAAAALAEHGVGHGDRVVLCLPTGPEFITAFFGTQLLGAIPTAIAVPARFGGAAGFEGPLLDLADYLRPAAIITTTAVLDALPEIAGTSLIDGAALLARATASDAPAHPARLPDVDDLAVIQCTSGSTGRPKGVMISHANLAANCEQFTSCLDWTDADPTVSWAPLYHDMGLIVGLLCPVYNGGHAVLMPSTRFLRAPVEWLQHINDYRGAFSAAPNFAFGYAAARIRDEDLEGVDLSCWRAALCGAEPVQAATVQRFLDRFARWGLPSNALVPAYGMAEASLVITSTRADAPLRYDSIDRQVAVAEARVVDVDPHGADALRVVDCGEPVPGTEVRVVDADGVALGEDRIGHVQFRGPSRTVGYFDLPEETAASVDAPDWWKTGDIGYLRDGGLRITGRAKDLIIIRGANYFPTDFEQAAETVPGVRLGAVVAVGHRPDGGDSEELHLIVETELGAEEHEELRRAVRSAISARTGVLTAAVHLVPKRSIPKTTSGKLQRSKARALFVDGAEPVPQSSPS
ncbi:Acyl-CoA synthetase (AMP-forming)/AMP-acid ligase II [Saccharopolyspora kobensis]|uniref:Acyl-CoA synthetase (AMP-forming)/AMP-acid ligase II n=1 Tax=Saccharopolyspora kobensis TaxID=146035 RepID=A0A1H6A5E6_9PSEU|nr:fatty acyl-AMP ligase [Saccharopolyspora kobensis]SEG42966.1 Acyl-CoA synthetase (AMP-forming)/AMP-acid ligase II [Saccharopolyspora kobensis]SFE18685.1 Acyl-CoA synthetase (AMP-forming)/AMP-acid ligase II [Saccharopolyspora kobensis]